MRGFAVAGAALGMFASAALHAQTGALNYAFSYHASAYNDTTSLVAFAIEFSDAGLVYAKQENGEMLGQLYTRLSFREKGNPEPFVVDWVTAVPQRKGGEERAMLGNKLVALPPGDYDAQIYYQDEASPKRRDSASFPLHVPSFAGGKLQLSDLMVVNEAGPGEDPGNPFFRNGYVVLPNVSSAINPPFLVLNTYTEVYNASEIASSEYQLVYRLADSSRKVFYESKVNRPRPSSRISVELNSIPLDSLPSGRYYVSVKAYDGLARWATDSVMVFQSFVVSNPEFDAYRRSLATAAAADLPDGSNVVDPEYSGLKEEELDSEYGKVRYIASERENNVWEGLSGAEPKARFLTRFWGVRDPSPGTPENESRQEYYKRVEEARNMYSAPMAPRGWDSDRGRVLLKYGKPDGVERHFQEFNRKPYEIWTYTQMNYQFVFIDRTQTGAFSLVHSTAPSEVRNLNWEQVATLNNTTTGSSYEGSR